MSRRLYTCHNTLVCRSLCSCAAKQKILVVWRCGWGACAMSVLPKQKKNETRLVACARPWKVRTNCEPSSWRGPRLSGCMPSRRPSATIYFFMFILIFFKFTYTYIYTHTHTHLYNYLGHERGDEARGGGTPSEVCAMRAQRVGKMPQVSHAHSLFFFYHYLFFFPYLFLMPQVSHAHSLGTHSQSHLLHFL